MFKTHLRLFAQDLQKFAQNETTYGLKSFASLSQIPQSTNNRTIYYLVNTLGFSNDSALVAAKRIHLKPTANPDVVLDLFKAYGFASSDTANIFYRHPSLLLANPDTILKPKFEFLSQNGISSNVLVDLISRDPSILRRSLDKQIVTCIDFLINFFGSTDGIVALFSTKRGTWVLQKFYESVAPNIKVLRANGVPDSNIAKMILVRPKTLSTGAEEFSDIVEKTKETSFHPSSLMFIHGMCTLSGMKKDKWLSKLHVFKSFGWSEEQFQSLFLKQPKFMNSSEDQIKRALDFFMNKLDWTPVDISKYPLVLSLSFEKSVISRSSILQRLILKGFIKKTSIGNGHRNNKRIKENWVHTMMVIYT